MSYTEAGPAAAVPTFISGKITSGVLNKMLVKIHALGIWLLMLTSEIKCPDGVTFIVIRLMPV